MSHTNECFEIIDRTGNLYDVNVNEAWRKLTSRQFANEPVRGIEEIISNAVDSYPDDAPLNKRKIAVDFKGDTLSVTDWGQGMSLERIDCLLTMGGSDKHFDDKKIGQFGIGFCSIFNPTLGTRSVLITTRCDGRGVDLIFTVENHEKPPRIDYRMLNRLPTFSTRVTICFQSVSTVQNCANWLAKRSEFYPYQLLVNKEKISSIWDKSTDAYHFSTENTRGRLLHQSFPLVRVLCKYCHVATATLDSLQRPSSTYEDLSDYNNFPWVPGYAVDINCDTLSVVLSRNSFYIDSAFYTMMRELAVVLKGRLLALLAKCIAYDSDTIRLILTNQYIFRSKMRELCKVAANGLYTSDPACLEHRLFDAKIYKIESKEDLFSLRDISQIKSPDLPLFFCTRIESLSWLGRRYKHDFIVLPPVIKPYHPPVSILFKLLDGAFPCKVVDLDTIHHSPDVVKNLVETGVIDPALLTKNISLSPKKQISIDEAAVIAELHQWLQKPAIHETMVKNLVFPVERIDVGVFESTDDDRNILAALFDEKGKLLAATPAEIKARPPMRKVFVGLNVSSPLFKRVAVSKNSNRSFYLMDLIAHELVCTQKLIPHSAKFYYVRNKMERDITGALQRELLYNGDSGRKKPDA